MSDEAPLGIQIIIARVMDEVPALPKGQRNQQQGFDFRGIDDVLNAVGPRLRQYGVVPTPLLEQAGYRDVLTSQNKPTRECTVQVRYRFWGPAGDHLDVVVPGEALDQGDKGTAKAMSVAYRIALLQLLALPTGDRDPDADSYQRNTPNAGQLRSEIASLATEKGYDVDTIERDFSKAMNGSDIRTAGVPVLAEYKHQLHSYPDAGSEQ